MKLLGRKEELAQLEGKYHSKKTELVVVYGRRRVGKSALIKKFCTNKLSLQFEALEGEHTNTQITHFMAQLNAQSNDPLLKGTHFSNWEAVFTYLTGHLKKQKKRVVLFFDEFQWQAASQQKLVTLIKFYWDNHWKNLDTMLILCGSVSSFMVNNVIRSKALYGRVTLEINLKGLLPLEAKAMFHGKRSNEEILQYLLVFGSIPKYLEEINLNRSFYQNINQLCFTNSGLMVNEMDRVFHSQFRQSQTYLRLSKILSEGPASKEDLRNKVKLRSGGGMLNYLENLELAGFIRSYTPLGSNSKSRIKKYKLTDEYLVFYFKYIEPNLQRIKEEVAPNLFERLSDKSLEKWLGYAFERFCLKYQRQLAAIMGFENAVLNAGPYFGRTDPNFQIDLIYQRSDNVYTLCEIKYLKDKVTAAVIKEVEQKCKLFPLPRGCTLEKALISLHGPDDTLHASEYFHHHVSLKDILQN